MKTNILVVDDEPNYLIVLSELLKEEGYEVITAQKGEDGLKVVQDTDLDLVSTFVPEKPAVRFNELVARARMHFVDIPPPVEYPRPTLPHVQFVQSLLLKESKPIQDQNLLQFVEEAEDGFISTYNIDDATTLFPDISFLILVYTSLNDFAGFFRITYQFPVNNFTSNTRSFPSFRINQH